MPSIECPFSSESTIQIFFVCKLYNLSYKYHNDKWTKLYTSRRCYMYIILVIIGLSFDFLIFFLSFKVTFLQIILWFCKFEISYDKITHNHTFRSIWSWFKNIKMLWVFFSNSVDFIWKLNKLERIRIIPLVWINTYLPDETQIVHFADRLYDCLNVAPTRKRILNSDHTFNTIQYDDYKMYENNLKKCKNLNNKG